MLDLHGRGALHIAAKKGCVECIRILLEHGARTEMKDSRGDTPLHLAASYGQLYAMEALGPYCCDEESHSSVESVDEHFFQKQDESFYESPREYGSNFETVRSLAKDISVECSDTWRHYNHTKNHHNDSGYFSTAWTRTSYYIPSKIEEERELGERSSLESVTDSVTDDDTIENDKTLDFTWMLAGLFKVLVSQIRHMNAIVKPRRSEQTHRINSANGMPFADPPLHVKIAMEKFKQSRQGTIRPGSAPFIR